MNYIERIREKKPLIHHITNYVVANETANITLVLGALPVMSHSIDDVEEMVSHASALVLNIGTLDAEQIDSMIIAGQEANKRNIPVILDPVGAGATAYRTESAKRIMREIKIAVVRGNVAEVSILAGHQALIAGVEALGGTENIEIAVKDLSQKLGAIVCATGPKDYVSDGKRLALVENGHPMLSTVTGTGCMATTLVAAFIAVAEDKFDACVEALASFGIIGELAADGTEGLPGNFHMELYNVTYNLTDEKIKERRRVRFV